MALTSSTNSIINVAGLQISSTELSPQGGETTLTNATARAIISGLNATSYVVATISSFSGANTPTYLTATAGGTGIINLTAVGATGTTTVYWMAFGTKNA